MKITPEMIDDIKAPQECIRRAKYFLQEFNIDTLEQLSEYKQSDILKNRQIGNKTLYVLWKLLEKHGLYFKKSSNTITLNQPKYECPKHGIHENVIVSMLKDYEGRWCQLCYLEKLDENGICRVKILEGYQDQL